MLNCNSPAFNKIAFISSPTHQQVLPAHYQPVMHNPHKVTTYVSICADSSAACYKYIMAVSYPNYFDIDGSSISIRHQFGANESFTPNRFDCNTNTAEFLLTAAPVEFLKSSPFTVIALNDRYTEKYCTDVKAKRYFMQFLKEYKK